MAERTQRLYPMKPVRRFDVFAEYQRIKYQQRGLPPDQAKGFALWMAKLVAARKLARADETRMALTERLAQGMDRLRAGAKFLELSGQPQTDELFDREIVQRMGEDFYHRVFSPAVAQAVAERKSYERIRDRLREPWNERRIA